MMRIGDRLLGKNDNKIYTIDKVGEKHVMIKIHEIWEPFSLTKELSMEEGSNSFIALYYIWNHFYTTKELRLMKLNELKSRR